MVGRTDRGRTDPGRPFEHAFRIRRSLALGIPSSSKYQSEGGPGFKECFQLVRRASTQTGRDLMRLLNAVIFNVILGNADAHAKNFSLLHADAGTRLAPLYDLMTTAFYPEPAADFAMRIGRAATLAELGPRDWQAFAEITDLGFQLVQRQIHELADKVPAAIPAVLGALTGTGLDQAVLERLGALVRGRAERMARI